MSEPEGRRSEAEKAVPCRQGTLQAGLQVFEDHPSAAGGDVEAARSPRNLAHVWQQAQKCREGRER